MGELLILAVLIVTIPRWAGAFQPIDKFIAFGVPITAIGTGIAMGLGTYYVIKTLQMVNRQYRDSLATWETHDKNMQTQGKQNHKPKPEKPRSRTLLATFFGILLLLTTISQTPYLVSEFTGTAVQNLLSRVGLWGYSIVLVLSPEIVIAALALAAHERGALKDDGKNRGGKGRDRLGIYDLVRVSLSQRLGKFVQDDDDVDAGIGELGETGERTQRTTKRLTCFCGWNATTSPRGMSSHMRVHKAEALEHETPTLAYKHFVEAYPEAYNGGEEFDSTPPDRETLERWFGDREKA